MKMNENRNHNNGTSMHKTANRGTTDHGTGGQGATERRTTHGKAAKVAKAGNTARNGGVRKAMGTGRKPLPGNAVGGAMKGMLELWWASRSPSEKMLTLQINMMMEDVEGDKRIEIRREMKRIKVRFIHILKQPEKGCLSAIMLPERASGGWN